MEIHTRSISGRRPMWEVTLVAGRGMSGETEGGRRRTVVVLEEGIGDTNEPALLEWDAIVVGKHAVGS